MRHLNYRSFTLSPSITGADPGGGGLGVVTPPPALDHQFFFFNKLFKYMWITSHGQCPRGGGCLWMCKSGCIFQFFGRADDVTRTMSKGGGACECPRVGVFVFFFGGRMTSRGQFQGGVHFFWRADDVTQTMSKRGGACECLGPPPLQEILYPRLYKQI